ncbi:hypothetical protein PHABIO_431 [Pseudomonas phage Phabio]|uniref:Uncharacterized protein n=1 Tax=Pseudomonas phage Phabio TaxID=2006668 RepID=A0A1Y0SU84_9CAUD|nr:hypothetical protein MZD05_gp431 [Pseudomonas phage Phabio]ARV77062.1 hypothetical protein PHABIO_431 [Pseudomonas phage Phabio]
MSLRDELYKIYQTVTPHATITVRCRRHPSHLRIVAKARNQALRRYHVLPPLAEHNTDTIVYRNYID